MLAAWSVFGPKATVAVPATGVGAVAITAVLLGFALRYDLAPPQDAPSQETPNLIVDIATVEAGTIIGGLVTVWLLSSL